MEGLRILGQTRDEGHYPAAAQCEDRAARQLAQAPVVPRRGDSPNSAARPQQMEARCRLSSSQFVGNRHVPDEMLFWGPSEKPIDSESAGGSPHTMQNPQQVHQPRAASVRVDLVNKTGPNYNSFLPVIGAVGIHMGVAGHISLRGVAVHNLKSIDVDIP